MILACVQKLWKYWTSFSTCKSLFGLVVYIVYLCFCSSRSDIPAEAGPIIQAPVPEDHTPETVSNHPDTPLPLAPPMRSPGHPVLQQLRDLDTSSSKFHLQLSSALYRDDYTRCVTNLQGNDLAWLVDFLDDVCRYAALSCSDLRRHRLLVVSSLPVILSESVCMNSEVYVELRRCSLHHLHLYIT